MGKTLETISTIDSAMRTFLAFVVCGAASVGGYFGYVTYNAKDIAARTAREELEKTKSELDAKSAQVAEQQAKILDQEAQLAKRLAQIEKLQTSLRLLKVDHRLARLNVLDQGTTSDGKPMASVEFVELGENGQPLGKPRQFILKGDYIYVDGWVVKFEDKYIEQAELDRATSLFVFKRIFSDAQNPKDGYALDAEGEQPLIYAQGGQPSALETKIWRDFWSISNDHEKAQELGIRAAHGDAVSFKPIKGLSYLLELRSTGDLTVKPDGPVPTSDVK